MTIIRTIICGSRKSGVCRLRKNLKALSCSKPNLYPFVSTTPALGAPPLLN
jgi:hypothetical protein